MSKERRTYRKDLWGMRAHPRHQEGWHHQIIGLGNIVNFEKACSLEDILKLVARYLDGAYSHEPQMKIILFSGRLYNEANAASESVGIWSLTR